MAYSDYARGPRREVKFETIFSEEFYQNRYDSLRLCATLVNGKPQVKFSKFWFHFDEEAWYPTKSNFFFSLEAWEKLVSKIGSLNNEIQKLGLKGNAFIFIFVYWLLIYQTFLISIL